MNDFYTCTWSVSTILHCHLILAVRVFGMDNLAVPKQFSLLSIQQKLPHLFSLPYKLRLLTIIPALLLTMLFYLDQVHCRFQIHINRGTYTS